MANPRAFGRCLFDFRHLDLRLFFTRIAIGLGDAAAVPRQHSIDRLTANRSIAGPTGQVAVRKPSAKLGGQVLPWCVENQHEPGVFFNTDWL